MSATPKYSRCQKSFRRLIIVYVILGALICALSRRSRVILWRLIVLRLEEKFFLSKSRLEIAEPVCFWVKLSEKCLTQPLGVPSLQELQDEDFLSMNSCDSSYADLSRPGRHGWATNRAACAGKLGVCAAEDLVSPGQGDWEVIAGSCISLHKPVVPS